MLLFGAALLIFIGLAHSYLGEKYLLIRLFKRDNLPKLLGSEQFTKRVLRFAWHITTLAWWGFAAILYFLHSPNEQLTVNILISIGLVFVGSGAFSIMFTRGKHVSWLFFFTIAGTCMLSAYTIG